MRVCLFGAFLAAMLVVPQLLQAQVTQPYAYRGKIIGGSEIEGGGEAAYIYEKADFDSRVIGTAKVGQIFDISKNVFNQAFYRIRLKPGVLGYIADSDIQPLFKSEHRVAAVKSQASPKKGKRSSKRNKSFEYTRFGGLAYAMIDYTEETMGGKPHENLNFVGAKISGPNVLLDGLLPVDVNFLIYSGAPSYYEQATRRPASGFMFIGDILFQTYWPHGPRALTYFGVGPLVKYSKFDVELPDSTPGRYRSYSLEDISLGAAFDLGVGFRLGSVALRVDYHYFWEKQKYGGLTAAIQMAF